MSSTVWDLHLHNAWKAARQDAEIMALVGHLLVAFSHFQPPRHPFVKSGLRCKATDLRKPQVSLKSMLCPKWTRVLGSTSERGRHLIKGFLIPMSLPANQAVAQSASCDPTAFAAAVQA